MIRRAFLVLLGGAVGAGLTLAVTQTPLTALGVSANAALADTYQEINLFASILRARAPELCRQAR